MPAVDGTGVEDNERLDGVSETVKPGGAEYDRETVSEKPQVPVRVTVDDAEEPGVMLREVGFADIVKSGGGLMSQTCSSEVGLLQEPPAQYNLKSRVCGPALLNVASIVSEVPAVTVTP